MNKVIIYAVAICAFAASTLVTAQTPPTPPMKAGSAQPDPGMDVDMKGQMIQMDARMAQMQAMHENVMKATTPEERRMAMGEQRKAMQASMAMMNQMMLSGAMMAGQSCGMMAGQGCPHMGGKATDKPVDSGMADMGATMPMMQMMQKRMDMMQMMMQTMMDQQGTMGGAQGHDAAHKN